MFCATLPTDFFPQRLRRSFSVWPPKKSSSCVFLQTLAAVFVQIFRDFSRIFDKSNLSEVLLRPPPPAPLSEARRDSAVLNQRVSADWLNHVFGKHTWKYLFSTAFPVSLKVPSVCYRSVNCPLQQQRAQHRQRMNSTGVSHLLREQSLWLFHQNWHSSKQCFKRSDVFRCGGLMFFDKQQLGSTPQRRPKLWMTCERSIPP